MLRCSASGREGSSTSGPSVMFHAVPSVWALTSMGRSSLMRTSSASRMRVLATPLMLRPISPPSDAVAITSSLPNTSQSVSPRRNTAAGVAAENGNSNVTLSPLRLMRGAIPAPGSETAGVAGCRVLTPGFRMRAGAGRVAGAGGAGRSASGSLAITFGGADGCAGGGCCVCGAAGLSAGLIGGGAACGGAAGAVVAAGRDACGAADGGRWLPGASLAGWVCGGSASPDGRFVRLASSAASAESSSERAIPSRASCLASAAITSRM